MRTKWSRILFLGLAVVLLALGVSECGSTQRWTRTAVRTQGKLIDYDERQSHDRRHSSDRKTYAPVFELTVSNQVHRIHADHSSTKRPFAIGTAVPVRYQPGNPSDARLDTFTGVWGRTLGLFVGSTVFLLLAAFGPFHWRRSVSWGGRKSP